VFQILSVAKVVLILFNQFIGVSFGFLLDLSWVPVLFHLSFYPLILVKFKQVKQFQTVLAIFEL